MSASRLPEAENPFADSHADSRIKDYELQTIAFGTPKPGFKKYVLWYKLGWLDGTLHLGSSKTPPVYFFQSKISRSLPQLYLRRCVAGEDEKSGPVVNFARLPSTSRHMLLGRGTYSKEADDAGQIAWEELTRDKNMLHRSDYHFSTSVGDTSALGNAKTPFRWRKNMERLLSTVYDCVNEKTGDVVARLFSGGAFDMKKGGEFDVAEGLSRDLEEYLIMSSIAIWASEALNYGSLLSGFSSSSKEDRDKQD